MNKKLCWLLLPALLLVCVLCITACGGSVSPYDEHNKDGYTVSVRYDANGGVFTTNTTVITDTYNLSRFETNEEGKKEITLFSPDDSRRGNQAYSAAKVGYYLAGWYTERTEVAGENGEKTYVYGNRWDFSTEKLALDENGTYDANQPVITLYAAWVPAFTYEFYVFGEDGKPVLVDTVNKNPTGDTTLRLPALDPETGAMGAPNDFPSLRDKTYDKIYADAEKQNEIDTATLVHTGRFDKETATLTDPVMKIYCSTLDGRWFAVDTPEKITKNPYPNAHYVLLGDIDFAGKTWPSNFRTAEFTGGVMSEGDNTYTIKNIALNQSDINNKDFGLFGKIGSGAVFRNVTFENITVNINAGSRIEGAKFGILAGTVVGEAELSGVTVKDSRLVLTEGVSASPDYLAKPSYGLVCGAGKAAGMTYEGCVVLFTAGEGSALTFADPLDEETGYFVLQRKQ